MIMTDSITQLLEDMKTDANICRLIHRVDQARAIKHYSDRLEALIGESEVDVIAMRTEIAEQQEVITRLEAEIERLQDAWSSSFNQAMNNGLAYHGAKAEIERLEARIKDYQAACEQKQEIINGYGGEFAIEVAKRAALAEREACVMICDDISRNGKGGAPTCVRVLRERSNDQK